MTRSGHEFIGRVLRATSLRGYELLAFWTHGTRTEATLFARPAYGVWKRVDLGEVGESFARAPGLVTAADVVMRLRNLDRKQYGSK